MLSTTNFTTARTTVGHAHSRTTAHSAHADKVAISYCQFNREYTISVSGTPWASAETRQEAEDQRRLIIDCLEQDAKEAQPQRQYKKAARYDRQWRSWELMLDGTALGIYCDTKADALALLDEHIAELQAA